MENIKHEPNQNKQPVKSNLDKAEEIQRVEKNSNNILIPSEIKRITSMKTKQDPIFKKVGGRLQ